MRVSIAPKTPRRRRRAQFGRARESYSGSVIIYRLFECVAVHSDRPANLNLEIPACITKDPVPKVTPSYSGWSRAYVGTTKNFDLQPRSCGIDQIWMACSRRAEF